VTSRRTLLAGLPAPLAAPALAQAPWPNRPSRLVVPHPPGGGSDFAGRLQARGLVPFPSSLAEFATLTRQQRTARQALIRSAGLQPE